MDLDLSCVASFAVLVEERHYGRAAARMHLTSPALSKRIQRLERQLGARLLERGPAGGVALTSAGLRFSGAAQDLLRAAASAREAAALSGGALRLGFPAVDRDQLAFVDLHAIAMQFATSCPGHRIDWIRIPFTRLNNALSNGEVDVLFTGPPIWQVGLVCTPLALQITRTAVVGQRNPLFDAIEVHAHDLADLPMVYDPSLPREWIDPFVLEDIRPIRYARLVECSVADHRALYRNLAADVGVAASFQGMDSAVPSSMRILHLRGAAPVRMHVATRSGDRRASVRSLVEAICAVASREAARSRPGQPSPQ